jgi:hypothetical protein
MNLFEVRGEMEQITLLPSLEKSKAKKKKKKEEMRRGLGQPRTHFYE